MMTMQGCLLLIVAVIAISSTDAFVLRPLASVGSVSSSKSVSCVGILQAVKDDGDDNDFLFPKEELLPDSGKVDWDAEWKKVVQREQEAAEGRRPGQDYYKSEAEIAAIRAANQVTRQLDRTAETVAKNAPGIPSWDSVKGDWKFWVGILAVVSFGTALLTATPPPPQDPAAGSYFI